LMEKIGHFPNHNSNVACLCFCTVLTTSTSHRTKSCLRTQKLINFYFATVYTLVA
jgi:hypothetical protein